jgi:hypothetical protein
MARWRTTAARSRSLREAKRACEEESVEEDRRAKRWVEETERRMQAQQAETRQSRSQSDEVARVRARNAELERRNAGLKCRNAELESQTPSGIVSELFAQHAVLDSTTFGHLHRAYLHPATHRMP